MDGLTGVTAIETGVGTVTAKTAEPLTLPSAAETCAVPLPAQVARPLPPGALLMVTTDESDVVHVTDPVRNLVLPSPYVPNAVNCCAGPLLKQTADDADGLTFSDISRAVGRGAADAASADAPEDPANGELGSCA